MESVAPTGASDQEAVSGVTHQREGVCADGKVRTGTMQIVPQGKRGQFFRYIYVKPPPPGVALKPRSKALLAIIEAGMEKGGFNRRELKTVVEALMKSNQPICQNIRNAQVDLLKHGLMRIEEAEAPPELKKIYLTDQSVIDNDSDNG